MKLKFKHQPFQTAAVAAVVDCFTGQTQGDVSLASDACDLPGHGTGNGTLQLSADQLLANLQAVQRRQGLHLSTALLSSLPAQVNLDVEMETGTGKTYCYLKTVFELHRCYGWGKFIVVVPSIAIREGVQQALAMTADHFAEDYGRRIRFFAYDSRQLHQLESFASDGGINLMVINIQAFNAAGKDQRRIYEAQDAFQSRRPIDVISATRPLLILDEPQKMEGRKTLEALAQFRPLLILRYSATHRSQHNRVYRLDALDAYRQKLVKRIAVCGVIPSHPTDTRSEVGQRRQLIHEAIKAHLAREREVFVRGIKVLSLFFIDEVVKYRDYAAVDERGEYARIFEEEYQHLVAECLAELPESEAAYGRYLAEIPVARTHSGYFSVDRKSKRLTDPRIKTRGDRAGLCDDADAYHLILRDKERLLSFAEPVRFLFSHSALREGWDNPNVFVLCMLKQSFNTTTRRQEVGRGLRLCVNQQGERMDDPATVHELNLLTVIASESYQDFVGALQRELCESLTGRAQDEGAVRPSQLPEVLDARLSRPVASVRSKNQDKTPPLQTVDTKALIPSCVQALDRQLRVSPMRLAVDHGLIDDPISLAQLHRGGEFTPPATTVELQLSNSPGTVRYDLVGRIADATQLTRRTVARVLSDLRPEVFEQYAGHPERFIRECARLILAELA